MIYLDSGATSFPKPACVCRAVSRALRTCANPGRGGHAPASEAARQIFHCREAAGDLFSCRPEQVALTSSCTHGLNIAIRTLIRPGGKAVISGFEHNAVTRPLHALGAEVKVAGRKLFDWEDTLEGFYQALKAGADGAVFTHVSNVFGYILPVEELAGMCRRFGVPFILDAAQSAGALEVNLAHLGADFIAMPGHKGLLGPQGTGLLLCGRTAEPVLYGGTGSVSRLQEMPEELPDRLEPGTLNVPGFAGLAEGIRLVSRLGTGAIFRREHRLLEKCVQGLKEMGHQVYAGPHQAATVSFLPGIDAEDAAAWLARKGIAVRAGLHCAPTAHESAGTLDTGTLRISIGHETSAGQIDGFLRSATKIPRFPY